MPVITHPTTATFWFPANVAESSAAIRVVMKAPEFGDTYTEGRNLTVTQPRSGAIVVYDHGTPFSKPMKLSFRDIPDVERAAFIVLLEQIGWTAGVLSYKDYNGVVRPVRVMSTRLETKAMSAYNKYSLNPIYTFDFDVDFVDVSSSILTSQDTTIMPSALTLHLADLDSPHAPETASTIVIGDGLKLLDTILVDDWKACIWIGIAALGASRHMFQIQGDHNGTSSADATVVSSTNTVSNDIGSTTSIITYDVSLSGAGTAQVMRFRASTSVNGYTLTFRRIRIGKT